MVLFQMIDELLAAVEELRALVDLAAGVRLVTTPTFVLEVLRVLVSLPVVLAAEDLAAFRKGAAIGLGVSLLVLPVGISVLRM